MLYEVITGEIIDHKGEALKKSIIFKVFADFCRRGLFETGEGDMGAEFPVFRFQSQLKEAGGNFPLEGLQWLVFFNAGPDDTGVAPGREKANPRNNFV